MPFHRFATPSFGQFWRLEVTGTLASFGWLAIRSLGCEKMRKMERWPALVFSSCGMRWTKQAFRPEESLITDLMPEKTYEAPEIWINLGHQMAMARLTDNRDTAKLLHVFRLSVSNVCGSFQEFLQVPHWTTISRRLLMRVMQQNRKRYSAASSKYIQCNKVIIKDIVDIYWL